MKVQGVEGGYVALQSEAGRKTLPGEGNSGPPVAADRLPEWPGEQPEEKVDPQKLQKAVEQANKTMETYSTELRFSIHQASGEIMVKVVDTRDNRVIREIPPERVLNFVAYVKKLLGLIIDKFI